MAENLKVGDFSAAPGSKAFGLKASECRLSNCKRIELRQ